MRSKRHVGQGSLFDDPGEEAAERPAPPSGLAPPSGPAPVARSVGGTRRRRLEQVPGDFPDVHVLTGREFARRGWPAGTLLHLQAAHRADRGTLVIVDDGGRVRVGHLGLDRGRPALLTDEGSTWLSGSARVVAVVASVEVPLVV